MKKLLLLSLFIFPACVGQNEPTNKKSESAYWGRIKWDFQNGPVLNLAYILTVDSVEYIVVRQGEGVAIIKHQDLRK